MNVSILLADRGTPNPQARTLNLLNVGWTHTFLRPAPVPSKEAEAGSAVQLITAPFVVAVFYEVEPKHCNHSLELKLSLLTEDGKPVELPSPSGVQPMVLVQRILVPSLPLVPIGSPGVANTMIEIVPGLPLSPGTYSWVVELAGEQNPNWHARFYVLPPQQQPQIVFSPSKPGV